MRRGQTQLLPFSAAQSDGTIAISNWLLTANGDWMRFTACHGAEPRERRLRALRGGRVEPLGRAICALGRPRPLAHRCCLVGVARLHAIAGPETGRRLATLLGFASGV